MPLFRLAGVSNFCSNSLSLFLSIVRIFSLLKPYRSKSFVTHSSYDFLGRPFFPIISTPITSTTAATTTTTADSFELSNPQSSQQHPPYHEEHQSTPYQPVSPSHIILIIRRSTLCNLASSATLSSHV